MSFQAMAWAGIKVPKKAGKIRAREIAEIWLAHNVALRCDYCERDLICEGTYVKGGMVAGFTVDHIVPTVRGGKDEWSNFVPACSSCNAQKREKTAEEYRQWLRDKGKNPRTQWLCKWQVAPDVIEQLGGK